MKVGWILTGPKVQPSTRIMALNVIDYMNTQQICENTILWLPEKFTPIVPPNVNYNPALDCVIFQKVCMGSALEHLLWYKNQGIKTIYIIDDLVMEAKDMILNADIVISGSQYLSDMIKKFFNQDSIVMVDAYETDSNLFKRDYFTDKVRVLWFGTEGHFKEALVIKSLVEDLGYEFITISSCKEATKAWNINTIWADIISSDIVVLPFLGSLPPFEMAKGNNRLTQTMVLGIPTIASPIPAYCSIVEQYKNGIITFNNDLVDWEEALGYLGDQKIREKMGQKAHEDVVDKYHISKICEKWKEIFYGKS